MPHLVPIAYFHSPLTSKFGIPRQSGLVDELRGSIVFEKPYNHPDALRGIEDFDYLWLIWGFSENPVNEQKPPLTVRPPRLGGNKRLGVFATRSPFRPNGLGLSCVRIARVEQGVIHVLGADLMNGTPIYDVKPYIPYADAHPEARSGFAPDAGEKLTVDCPAKLEALVPAEKRLALRGVLANDPRPRYQKDPERVYGLNFAGQNVKFTVDGDRLTVKDVGKREE